MINKAELIMKEEAFILTQESKPLLARACHVKRVTFWFQSLGPCLSLLSDSSRLT